MKRFNVDGITAWRSTLARLRADPTLPVPVGLLTDAALTSDVDESIDLDKPGFKTKRDAATYLTDKLAPLAEKADLFKDVGLWGWLALFYFDDVCPPKGGRRVPGADARHVLRLDDTRYTTRHALMTPVLIMSVAPVYNRLLLDTPLTTLGKVTETVMKKLYVTRSPGVFEAMELLYFDPVTAKARPGVVSPEKPGNVLTRLPVRLRQLEMTYDLAVLPGPRIVRLLGREFDVWGAPVTAA